ncbi:glycosyltransferase family 2 protein [Clostridium sp. DL1XJH146]
MKQITIFTPTYSRAYILPRLYNSLKNQTCQDFIWLIVDDGSTDNTYNLIKEWISENKIQIEYHKQENQGKSMAHNKGVELTKTELFTCVDSDDFLSSRAVEDILKSWNSKNNDKLAGILAYKGLPNGKSLTIFKNTSIKSTTLKDGYSLYGLRGDTMLIFRTDIISMFKFPQFEGEKFVPEAYLYDLIDQQGKLFILREVLYYCEYLNDGYTNNISKLLAENPYGYLAYIKQRLLIDIRMIDKVADTIRYTAMCISSGEKNFILNSIYPILTILTYPLGVALYIKKYRSYN